MGAPRSSTPAATLGRGRGATTAAQGEREGGLGGRERAGKGCFQTRQPQRPERGLSRSPWAPPVAAGSTGSPVGSPRPRRHGREAGGSGRRRRRRTRPAAGSREKVRTGAHLPTLSRCAAGSPDPTHHRGARGVPPPCLRAAGSRASGEALTPASEGGGVTAALPSRAAGTAPAPPSPARRRARRRTVLRGGHGGGGQRLSAVSLSAPRREPWPPLSPSGGRASRPPLPSPCPAVRRGARLWPGGGGGGPGRWFRREAGPGLWGGRGRWRGLHGQPGRGCGARHGGVHTHALTPRLPASVSGISAAPCSLGSCSADFGRAVPPG